jgi:hypothetical protein
MRRLGPQFMALLYAPGNKGKFKPENNITRRCVEKNLLL